MDHFGIDFTPELDVNSAAELFKNLDANREMAKRLFYSGLVEKRLSLLGEEHLQQRAREIRGSISDENVGLESFLRESGTLPLPQVKVTPDSFDIETFEGAVSAKFTIENVGRGYMMGEIHSDSPWAVPSMTHFAGNRLHMSVEMDLSGMESGSENAAFLHITGGDEPVTVAVRVKRRGFGEALVLYEEQKFSKVLQICDAILREQPEQADAIFLEALCYFREANVREAFQALAKLTMLPREIPALLLQDFFAELRRDEIFFPNLDRIIHFYERLLPGVAMDYREKLEDNLADCYLKKAIIVWDKLSKKRDIAILYAASTAHMCERSPFFNDVFYPFMALPLSHMLTPFKKDLTKAQLLNSIGGPIYAVDRLVEKSRLLSPRNQEWGKFSKKLRGERKDLFRRGLTVLAIDIGFFMLFLIMFLGYHFQHLNDLYEQGVDYLRKGNYEKAVSSFEKSIEMGYKPTACMLKLSEAHHLWAREFARNKIYFLAVEHYNLAHKNNPLNKGASSEKFVVIQEWAIAMMNERNYREAYMKFELLLTLDPGNPRVERLKRKALFAWAYYLLDIPNFVNASEVLAIISNNYPEDREIRALRDKLYIAWGESFARTHAVDEAIEKWEYLMKFPPLSPAAGELRNRNIPYRGMVYVEGKGIWKVNENEKGSRYYVTIPSFYMDRTEVTNGQFMMFTQATGYVTQAERLTPGGKKGEVQNPLHTWKAFYRPGREKYPVICIAIEDAQAYCDWAGKSLPSSEQHEMAAAWWEKRAYPWGDEWDRSRCNNMALNDSNLLPAMLDLVAGRGTLPVGLFPGGKSPQGIYDLSGNAWEWVYFDEILMHKTKRSFYLTGGGWNSSNPGDFLSHSRMTFEKLKTKSQLQEMGDALLGIGFRCVK
jgi:formylglycine-generating enzyme required for sulfatase activity